MMMLHDKILPNCKFTNYIMDGTLFKKVDKMTPFSKFRKRHFLFNLKNATMFIKHSDDPYD